MNFNGVTLPRLRNGIGDEDVDALVVVHSSDDQIAVDVQNIKTIIECHTMKIII